VTTGTTRPPTTTTPGLGGVPAGGAVRARLVRGVVVCCCCALPPGVPWAGPGGRVLVPVLLLCADAVVAAGPSRVHLGGVGCGWVWTVQRTLTLAHALPACVCDVLCAGCVCGAARFGALTPPPPPGAGRAGPPARARVGFCVVFGCC